MKYASYTAGRWRENAIEKHEEVTRLKELAVQYQLCYYVL